MHEEHQTLHLVYEYPEHEPRRSDVHYKVFNQTKERLRKLGKLKCWIDNKDCRGNIELHHALVEFSLANDVDEEKFKTLYPEFHIESDEDFLNWIESEGNCLPLCVFHHRGLAGIHTIHYSAWVVQRFMKDGIVPPERKDNA